MLFRQTTGIRQRAVWLGDGCVVFLSFSGRSTRQRTKANREAQVSLPASDEPTSPPRSGRLVDRGSSARSGRPVAFPALSTSWNLWESKICVPGKSVVSVAAAKRGLEPVGVRTANATGPDSKKRRWAGEYCLATSERTMPHVGRSDSLAVAGTDDQQQGDAVKIAVQRGSRPGWEAPSTALGGSHGHA
jgi:hypothetical protein